MIQCLDNFFIDPRDPVDPEEPYAAYITSRRARETREEDQLPADMDFSNHYSNQGYEIFYMEYTPPNGGSTSSSQTPIINATLSLPLGTFNFPACDLIAFLGKLIDPKASTR